MDTKKAYLILLLIFLGGINAIPHSWPAQAMLLLSYAANVSIDSLGVSVFYNSTNRFICGGSLSIFIIHTNIYEQTKYTIFQLTIYIYIFLNLQPVFKNFEFLFHLKLPAIQS